MTREVKELLECFDIAYDNAVISNDDDDLLGQMCDCIRRQFLGLALEKAETIDDCDAILMKPFTDRNKDFIAEVKAKREQVKNKIA